MVKVKGEPTKTAKKCMYGAKCRNAAQCTFRHPAESSATSTAANSRSPSPTGATVSPLTTPPVMTTNGITKAHPITLNGIIQKTHSEPQFVVPLNQHHHAATANHSHDHQGPSNKTKQTKKQPVIVTPSSSLEDQLVKEEVVAQQSISQSATSTTKKKACRFGAKCHNPKCKFGHPVIEPTPPIPATPVTSTPPPPPPIAELHIPFAADLEETLVKEALEQQQKKKKLSPIRRAQEEAARLLREEQELDELLKEQEEQRMADAEDLARGLIAPSIYEPQQQQQVPLTTTTTSFQANLPPKEAKQPPNPIPRSQQAPAKLVPPKAAKQAAIPVPQSHHKQVPHSAAAPDKQAPDRKTTTRKSNVVPAKANSTPPQPRTAAKAAAVNQVPPQPPGPRNAAPPTKAKNKNGAVDNDDPPIIPPSQPGPRLVAANSKKPTSGGVAKAVALEKKKTKKAATNGALPPGVKSKQTHRFTVQLQGMRDMGFTDEKAALDALESSNGDLNDAVEFLLMSQPSPSSAVPDGVQVRHQASIPDESFNGLLQQMHDMGFRDEQAAAKALDETGGDLNAAVELLLLSRLPPAQSAAVPNSAAVPSSAFPCPAAPVVIALTNEDVVEDAAREARLRLEQKEQDRQKADRKAAKKERQRLQKAKAGQTDSRANTSSGEENVDPMQNENDEDEEHKKLRWREELRLQKERAAEKKEEKKTRRREQLFKDLERQAEQRAESWENAIAEEQKTVELLVKLCVAEFCRVHENFDQRSLSKDNTAGLKLLETSQAAFRVLYQDSVPSRVVVKGMKQQDLNDRTGVIDHWDEEKGKFCVGLETKKGKQRQLMFFPAGNLEVQANDASKKSRSKNSDPVYSVNIPSLFSDLDLVTDIFKSDIDRMKKAASVDDFVVMLMRERREEERLAKEREEDDRRQEEKARQRRAKQREKEQKEWEERQRQYMKQKEEYKQWRSEEKKENSRSAGGSGHRNGGCPCPECMFERMFFGGMGGRGFGGRAGFAGPGFSFFFGPGGGGGGFYRYDDDDDDDDDDEDFYDSEDGWDRKWNRMHEDEEAEKDQEAADLLGVSVDATADEIKRVFRKKALKYHPDKYRAEHHDDGATKEEAEEHFKGLSSAYDHLMSRLDD